MVPSPFFIRIGGILMDWRGVSVGWYGMTTANANLVSIRRWGFDVSVLTSAKCCCNFFMKEVVICSSSPAVYRFKILIIWDDVSLLHISTIVGIWSSVFFVCSNLVACMIGSSLSTTPFHWLLTNCSRHHCSRLERLKRICIALFQWHKSLRRSRLFNAPAHMK